MVLTVRGRQVLEIQRLEQAIKTTRSPYLKKDYQKAIKRKKRELAEFDFWRSRK